MPPAGAYRGYSRWSYEEEELLRRHYPRYGAQYAARLLGRSQYAICARASDLGVTRPSATAGKPRPWARKGWSPPPWTPEDDEKLRRLHVERRTPSQIARALKRTKKDIVHRARSTGLYRDQSGWTAEEDHLLRKLYGTVPYREIAGRLGRSVTAVTAHAGYLGIAGARTWPPWTEEEKSLLRRIYGTMSVAEVAERVGRSVSAVARRAGMFGLTKNFGSPWSAEEDSLLTRLHAEGKGYAEIGRQLERTATSVGTRAAKLGLTVTQPMRVRWSAREQAVLRELYGRVTNRKIAARLGRSIASIGLKARELGIVDAPAPPWTEEEDRYMIRHYASKTRREIAEALERSIPAIAARAKFLGLSQKRTREDRNDDQ